MTKNNEKAPEQGGDKVKKLLREIVMRDNLCFPETDQDLDWFNEGLKKKHDLFINICEILELGKTDEVTDSFK